MLMFGCLYNNETIHVDVWLFYTIMRLFMLMFGCLYNNETIHVDVWLFIQ